MSTCERREEAAAVCAVKAEMRSRDPQTAAEERSRQTAASPLIISTPSPTCFWRLLALRLINHLRLTFRKQSGMRQMSPTAYLEFFQKAISALRLRRPSGGSGGSQPSTGRDTRPQRLTGYLPWAARLLSRLVGRTGEKHKWWSDQICCNICCTWRWLIPQTKTS